MNKLPLIGRIALTLGACLLVFFITREVYRDDTPEPATNSTVLLEQVRKVMKLVTVEGDFNELYSREDNWNYARWLADMVPGFKKRVLLRVKARVSVGYDLSGMTLTADERTRTVHLDLPDKPVILSLEHDIDYYDLDEGVFNHFAPHELSAIEADAKRRIRDQVEEGGLFAKAGEQRAELVALVRALVEGKGWTFEEGTAVQDGRTRLKAEGGVLQGS
ncbi:MAG: DUF4230 domain-containing protein [Bacteroidetes bacterium]|jgi:hypothetical protein|nr:DUF4230 domain-containing protein [Bacteroidota bacterium]MCC6655429.1 DUF4230 domain-containing protein [Flavobacteriales bacterium]HMU12769.1 DUF4230 domain-containing protein [Flavobacteriales bacterium]HRT53116.1 DUF4230 domain-containing protein [Flavobacteriales bacterium]